VFIGNLLLLNALQIGRGLAVYGSARINSYKPDYLFEGCRYLLFQLRFQAAHMLECIQETACCRSVYRRERHDRIRDPLYAPAGPDHPVIACHGQKERAAPCRLVDVKALPALFGLYLVEHIRPCPARYHAQVIGVPAEVPVPVLVIFFKDGFSRRLGRAVQCRKRRDALSCGLSCWSLSQYDAVAVLCVVNGDKLQQDALEHPLLYALAHCLALCRAQ